MKTTILGIVTILAAIASAAVSYLKTGTFDFTATVAAVTAGWGLIKAADSTTPATGSGSSAAATSIPKA